MADRATTESTGRSVDCSVGQPVDNRTVSVAGRTIGYAEYGDSVGQPVVVFHGTPGTHRLGGLFAPLAAERGIRLLAVDRPGYGEADPWPERRLADIGGVVAAVLDAAGVDSAGMVGFSGGGPHALAVAATHGDRVTSVDIISGSIPPTVGNQTPAMQRFLGAMATSTPRLFGRLFSGQAWIASHVSPAVVFSQYTDREIETFDQRVVDLLTADFVEAVGGSPQGVATEFRLLAQEWEFSVEAVDQPVRLWHGKGDTNVPLADAKRLSQRLPNSELTIGEGDHLSTLLASRARVLDNYAN